MFRQVIPAVAAVLFATTAPNLQMPASAAEMQGLPSLSLPASERTPTFQEASLSVADAAYPVVKGLTSRAVAPLAGKAVTLAATGDPKEIIKTIDAGLDAFLSVPPDRFFSTVRSLKAATSAAAAATSCNLICMPPVSSVEDVVASASDAISVTSPDKLKAFAIQGVMSLASGDKQQYTQVLAETLKFSLSLNRRPPLPLPPHTDIRQGSSHTHAPPRQFFAQLCRAPVAPAAGTSSSGSRTASGRAPLCDRQCCAGRRA